MLTLQSFGGFFAFFVGGFLACVVGHLLCALGLLAFGRRRDGRNVWMFAVALDHLTTIWWQHLLVAAFVSWETADSGGSGSTQSIICVITGAFLAFVKTCLSVDEAGKD